MSLVKDVLVSIIIPCYNSEIYIKDTIESIINQSVENIEIIVVNDGSTDKSVQIIESIEDTRIKIINQENKGVSAARNNGFSVSKGDFVIFFDADDIMSDGFIEKRIQILKSNLDLDFVCGEVQTFSSDVKYVPIAFIGAAQNIYEEILFYKENIATCPSNYLFRTNAIKKHIIEFNVNLSSPADRFYLLEVEKEGLKGTVIRNDAVLLYRIHHLSMSHNLSTKLADDTEKYYKELRKYNIIPHDLKRQALFKGYFIISASNFKLNRFGKAVLYGLKSFRLSPVNFIKKVC